MVGLGKSVVTDHDFRASLLASQDLANATWWTELYRDAFPTMIGMTIAGRESQRDHLDRVITLENGHTINVEEKVRPRAWPDFLLEFWSNEEARTPGWITIDGKPDFLAYVFLETRRGWILPWPQLRKAWRNHAREWVERFGIVRAPNRGYTTASCPVPIQIAIDAIVESMVVGWRDPDDDGTFAYYLPRRARSETE